VDGYTLQSGDVVLLTAQADARENGVLQFDGAELIRPVFPENLAAGAKVSLGVSVWCRGGAEHSQSRWVLSDTDNSTPDGYYDRYAILGTHELTFLRSFPVGGAASILENQVFN